MEGTALDSVLGKIDHRPWPLPAGPWVMAQRWHDLAFLHWPLPADELRDAVPRGLELDAFEGQAWLGVVPFRMSGVRLRGIPALPGISAFPELNVRTYVTRDGKPGAYFFSLDATSRFAVAMARRWYHLAYFHAQMSCRESDGWIEYRSRRSKPSRPGTGDTGAEFHGRYRPVGDVFHAARGTLEHFLVERYCLYTTDARGGLLRAEIHHPPWPLQPAEVEIQSNTMAAASGFRFPAIKPLAHFARRLDVVIWPLRRIATADERR